MNADDAGLRGVVTGKATDMPHGCDAFVQTIAGPTYPHPSSSGVCRQERPAVVASGEVGLMTANSPWSGKGWRSPSRARTEVNAKWSG